MLPVEKIVTNRSVILLFICLTSTSFGFLENFNRGDEISRRSVRASRVSIDRSLGEDLPFRRETNRHATEKDRVYENLYDRRSFRTGTDRHIRNQDRERFINARDSNLEIRFARLDRDNGISTRRLLDNHNHYLQKRSRAIPTERLVNDREVRDKRNIREIRQYREKDQQIRDERLFRENPSRENRERTSENREKDDVVRLNRITDSRQQRDRSTDNRREDFHRESREQRNQSDVSRTFRQKRENRQMRDNSSRRFQEMRREQTSENRERNLHEDPFRAFRNFRENRERSVERRERNLDNRERSMDNRERLQNDVSFRRYRDNRLTEMRQLERNVDRTLVSREERSRLSRRVQGIMEHRERHMETENQGPMERSSRYFQENYRVNRYLEPNTQSSRRFLDNEMNEIRRSRENSLDNRAHQRSEDRTRSSVFVRLARERRVRDQPEREVSRERDIRDLSRERRVRDMRERDISRERRVRDIRDRELFRERVMNQPERELTRERKDRDMQERDLSMERKNMRVLSRERKEIRREISRVRNLNERQLSRERVTDLRERDFTRERRDIRHADLFREQRNFEHEFSRVRDLNNRQTWIERRQGMSNERRDMRQRDISRERGRELSGELGERRLPERQISRENRYRNQRKQELSRDRVSRDMVREFSNGFRNSVIRVSRSERGDVSGASLSRSDSTRQTREAQTNLRQSSYDSNQRTTDRQVPKYKNTRNDVAQMRNVTDQRRDTAAVVRSTSSIERRMVPIVEYVPNSGRSFDRFSDVQQQHKSLIQNFKFDALANVIQVVLGVYLIGQIFAHSSNKHSFGFQRILPSLISIKEKVE